MPTSCRFGVPFTTGAGLRLFIPRETHEVAVRALERLHQIPGELRLTRWNNTALSANGTRPRVPKTDASTVT